VVWFSLGVIRKPTGFDPMSCEPDTVVVIDSPRYKKKTKKTKNKNKAHPNNHPIYSVEIEIGSSIFFNDLSF
jgi:hypothetical protein